MRQHHGVSASAAPKSDDHPEWSQLLVNAVNQPGVISAAYSRFWNYSVGNQFLALWTCMLRGLEPGPINTFAGWQKLGRHVKRGEKAITLCMPVTVRSGRKSSDMEKTPGVPADKSEATTDSPAGKVNDREADQDPRRTVFVYKPRWFVLSQTDGDPYQPTELPEWSEERALSALNIARIAFTHPDGNCQGFAMGRSVAISPVAALPHKTLFHELAHVLLRHTAEAIGLIDDYEQTPRSLREVEAEAVALICCESLGLPGADSCRGYIQNWLGVETLSDRSAHKIFKAADQILRAGRDDPIAAQSGEPAPVPAAEPSAPLISAKAQAHSKPSTKKGCSK